MKNQAGPITIFAFLSGESRNKPAICDSCDGGNMSEEPGLVGDLDAAAEPYNGYMVVKDTSVIFDKCPSCYSHYVVSPLGLKFRNWAIYVNHVRSLLKSHGESDYEIDSYLPHVDHYKADRKVVACKKCGALIGLPVSAEVGAEWDALSDFDKRHLPPYVDPEAWEGPETDAFIDYPDT